MMVTRNLMGIESIDLFVGLLVFLPNDCKYDVTSFKDFISVKYKIGVSSFVINQYLLGVFYLHVSTLSKVKFLGQNYEQLLLVV